MTNASQVYTFIKQYDSQEKKTFAPQTENPPLPPPAFGGALGGSHKNIWNFFDMSNFLEIKSALMKHKKEDRLDIAIAMAAEFADLIHFAEQNISSGYVRKMPNRKRLTLTEIIGEPNAGKE